MSRQDSEGVRNNLDTGQEEVRYGVLVLAVALLGVGGYGAYLLYPRFNLPVVDAVGLAVLSLAAGVGAFFSPCSFPLLATLLIWEARADQETRIGRQIVLRRALTYAAALSFGTVVFLALTSIIAAGGRVFIEQVTFTSLTGRIIRLIVGVLLILLGLVQIGVVRLPFHRIAEFAKPLLHSQARTRRRAPVLGFTIFGFAYLVAGFG